jgi:ketosteroid isomerase-like protein
VSGRNFPTAQDAENAFYEALERCDLEGMMAVWAEDEEIVCIHPAGQRIAGQQQVRASWAQLFAGGAHARVRVTPLAAVNGVMFTVHNVHEDFVLEGARPGDPRPATIVATNVYLRTAAGWRMVVHHASPSGAAPETAPPAEAAPKILH